MADIVTHQPAVRGLVLGHGVCSALLSVSGQSAGRVPAAAGGADAARAHGHPDRRERRADRLGAVPASRHRGRHRDERAAVPDERDPHRAERARAASRVVGGPWVTVQEDYFGDLADAIFIGEAEETWPRFLEDWQEGRHAARYEQAEKTDMTKVPTPRFDLLKMKHYAFGSLQFSRGCPFQCEFCDIIVTFGRRPAASRPAPRSSPSSRRSASPGMRDRLHRR